MRARKNRLTRGDIRSRINDSGHVLRDAEGEVEDAVVDRENVERTLNDLDLAATDDGVRDVERCLHDADDAASEAYEERDSELERLHSEHSEFERELKEGADLTELSQAELSDARDSARVGDVATRIGEALAVIQEELRILTAGGEQIRDLRNAGERRRREFRARMKERS